MMLYHQLGRAENSVTRDFNMDANTLISTGCAVPQGAAAVIFLMDRFKKVSGKTTTSKHSLLLAILLVVGTAGTAGTAIWLHDHPRIVWKTVVVEKPVTVEKLLPCPPSKSGSATTRGPQSPANTGSNNTTNYGGTSAPTDKPKPQ
jgi:hypothetical protein